MQTLFLVNVEFFFLFFTFRNPQRFWLGHPVFFRLKRERDVKGKQNHDFSVFHVCSTVAVTLLPRDILIVSNTLLQLVPNFEEQTSRVQCVHPQL